MKYAPLLLLVLGTACQKKTEDSPAPTPPPARSTPPAARFSVPASIESNVSFQVTNQSTDATSFLWTWGDGTTSTGTSPSHSFDWSGKLRIRLAASSATATDTTSQIIQVNPGAAPVSVLSAAPGRYRGRLYRTVYTSSSSSGTTTYRDTTMALTVPSPRQVHIFNNNFSYIVGSFVSPQPWAGHAPQRRNAMFSSLRNFVQLEPSGDSIYVYLYSGGVVRADAIWKFYGGKQP
ncbi:PKD domain-containing protein [Hymenobacter monticola]|uniref:PKD domain-containing protein n=1 Tax=Hymenobacter monticola TaxID=1705399 RepID=A0ABY4B434_9BACT|nr:PKD domain-containing protein [Hymenobacter monticola]UOE33092.1 PKD domain-containing protein [Hymenobacter monticola]